MKKLFTLIGFSFLTLATSALTPSAPSELKLTSDDTSSIELNWKLPATYVNGEDFADGTQISAVKIIRNSKEVASLQGPATSYTDHLASESYPDGYDYGLLTYEVAACVDGVWSETSLPEQIQIGEHIAFASIPWIPMLQGLDEHNCNFNWYFHNCKWTSDENGLTLMVDDDNKEWATILSSEPLNLEPRRHYLLEYSASSDDNCGIAIGIGNNLENTDFVQTIVNARTQHGNQEITQVDFIYEPKINGITEWIDNPGIKIMVSGKTCISFLKVSEYDSASLSITTVADSDSFQVFNVNGLNLGVRTKLEMKDFAPGLYILRSNNGKCSKVVIR